MLIGSIERPHMDGVHGAIDGTIELEEHVLLNQLKKFRNKKNIQLAGETY